MSAADAFDRSLHEFATAGEDEGKLKNVVRQGYEAVEAFAKQACRIGRDLSANRERLVSVLHLDATTAALLREFIVFANLHRHAEAARPPTGLTRRRTDLFVYETGILLRAGDTASGAE